MEDINNLLNSGEVPNIFADAAERAEVIDGIRKYAREDGHKDLNAGQLYNYFIARAKSNMHIVLAFSPIGDAFRERLRKFPALINCCTINWFFRYSCLFFLSVHFFYMYGELYLLFLPDTPLFKISILDNPRLFFFFFYI